MLQRPTASTLRILLIPITRRCYVLHANTIHKLKAQSDPNDPNTHYPPSRLTINHIPIINKIQSEGIRLRIDHYLNELHEFWIDCEAKATSHPKSLKGRLYQYSENALQRIDGYESFFGAVPYKQLIQQNNEGNDDELSLEYIIPNGVNINDAMNHLKYLSKYRRKYHQKWLYLSVSLLPFTALLGLLPGPNIFILYNGVRCYAHYRAYYGAMAIDQRYSELQMMDHHCLQQIYLDLKEGNKQYIDDDSLYELQQIFDCQHIYHHLHRVRYQVVELNKHQRYPLTQHPL